MQYIAVQKRPMKAEVQYIPVQKRQMRTDIPAQMQAAHAQMQYITFQHKARYASTMQYFPAQKHQMPAKMRQMQAQMEYIAFQHKARYALL